MNKRLLFSFFSLLTANTAFSQLPCERSVVTPSFNGGLNFNLDALFLESQLVHLDYSQTSDRNVTDRTYHSISTTYGYGGYALGLGYEFPCTANNIRLDYIHTMQTDNDSKNSGDLRSALFITPVITNFSDTVAVSSGGIPIGTVITSGSLINTGQLDFIKAHGSFTHDVLDLEAGQSFAITCDFRMRASAGIRDARLFNELGHSLGIKSTTDTITPLSSPTIIENVGFIDRFANLTSEVKSESSYSGLGPRFELEANYNLAIGFSLFGDISTALLVGDIRSRYNSHAEFVFTGTVDSIALENTDPTLTYLTGLAVGDVVAIENEVAQHIVTPHHVRIVPNTEVKLGINYCYAIPCTRTRVNFSGGYFIDHYWNGADFLFSRTNGEPTIESQAVSYDGIYLGFRVCC